MALLIGPLVSNPFDSPFSFFLFLKFSCCCSFSLLSLNFFSSLFTIENKRKDAKMKFRKRETENKKKERKTTPPRSGVSKTKKKEGTRNKKHENGRKGEGGGETERSAGVKNLTQIAFLSCISFVSLFLSLFPSSLIKVKTGKRPGHT